MEMVDQQKRLPVEIIPNPLVTSTVEVRYSTAQSSNAILPKAIALFADELPNVETSDIPSDIKKTTEQFKYAVDFMLSNESFRFSFSNSAFSFENVAEYKLWSNYFPFICRTMEKFFSIGHIHSIERIGVRYASVLNNTKDLSDVMNSVPRIGFDNYNEQFEQFRCTLRNGENRILVQLFNQAKATRNVTGESFTGVYIDIDAYHEGDIPGVKDIANKIDQLHKVEKELFFDLLRPDFLLKLNPRY